jgi:preprotein translocase subunit YajC
MVDPVLVGIVVTVLLFFFFLFLMIRRTMTGFKEGIESGGRKR